MALLDLNLPPDEDGKNLLQLNDKVHVDAPIHEYAQVEDDDQVGMLTDRIISDLI
uniref:Uncharacterized protein n=1 Tax=Oryza brachyantha TaxID=4533 RepID=J3LD09_ORYBR